MKYILFALCALMLGCTATPKPETQLVYISTPLKLPPKPIIPKIQAKDLSCITQDAKDDLLKRDSIMKGYIADLESTIEATHQ